MTPPSIDMAIEAVARFEFDRLERGDLSVKGGPLPWEKCEPGLREEMLDWAREALEAAAPHLQVAAGKDLRERLLSDKALDAAMAASSNRMPRPSYHAAVRAAFDAALNPSPSHTEEMPG